MNTTTDNANTVTVNHFHAYNPAAVPDVPEGRRLVKCLYRADADGNASKENAYIMAPDHITADAVIAHWDELQDYVVSYLQGVEDSWIKEDHKAGVTGLADIGFTMDKVIAALEAKGAGTRLNKEQVESWFDSKASDKILALVSASWGYPDNAEQLTEEQLLKLVAVGEAYKSKFAGLANPKANYLPEEAKRLRNALIKAELDDSGLGARFAKRLEKMETASADDLLAAL